MVSNDSPLTPGLVLYPELFRVLGLPTDTQLCKDLIFLHDRLPHMTHQQRESFVHVWMSLATMLYNERLTRSAFVTGITELRLPVRVSRRWYCTDSYLVFLWSLINEQVHGVIKRMAARIMQMCGRGRGYIECEWIHADECLEWMQDLNHHLYLLHQWKHVYQPWTRDQIMMASEQCRHEHELMTTHLQVWLRVAALWCSACLRVVCVSGNDTDAGLEVMETLVYECRQEAIDRWCTALHLIQRHQLLVAPLPELYMHALLVMVRSFQVCTHLVQAQHHEELEDYHMAASLYLRAKMVHQWEESLRAQEVHLLAFRQLETEGAEPWSKKEEDMLAARPAPKLKMSLFIKGRPAAAYTKAVEWKTYTIENTGH